MLAKTAARLILVLSAVVSVIPAVGQVSAGKSQIPVRIVRPIDDSVRVTIPKSTHPLAKPANDVGLLDGGTPLQRIIMMLGASPDQEYQARTLIDRQQTRGSSDYHRWITPQEFGAQFGPAPQDIAQVTSWLQQHGFTVDKVATSGRWLEFSGTAALVESAFQTQMHQYLINGEMHVANATDISIPAALSPVVTGLLSLHNFYGKPMLRRAPIQGPVTLRSGQPGFTDSNGNHFVTPGDLAAIYDLNPLYNGSTGAGTITGSGVTIGIVAVGDINQSDISSFQSAFGLPANAPTVVINGVDPGVDGGSDEASLDVEYSGAVARGANIDLVVSGGTLTTDPIFLSSSLIVDQNLTDIINVSFGNCEQNLTPQLAPDPNSAYNALWEQAAAQGISVFVSAGDTGAAGCDPNSPPGPTAAQDGLGVNGFGSTPFSTTVGGTEFDETVGGQTDATFWNPTNSATFSSAIGYIPEMVWDDICSPSTAGSFCMQEDVFSLAAGGGGISTVYNVPSYQTLAITGLTGANFPRRPVPDVSLDASNDHDPYIFCFSGDPSSPDCQVSNGQLVVNDQTFAGGTSFASPEFAGIMALVDQALGGRQGLANFVLYALAANESSSFSSCNSSHQISPNTPPGAACVFNDVTVGSNGVPGNDTLTGGAFIPPGDTSGQTGYNTTVGFDPATGLGSVNAATLVNAWKTLANGFEGSTTTLTTTPASPVSIAHGTAITVNVSVARQASTGTPSGSISLIAQGTAGVTLLTSQVGVTSEPITGNNGTATSGPVSINNLPGGTGYTLMAKFPGDGIFAGSTSSTVSVTVTPENSTTILKPFILNLANGTFNNGVSVAYGDPVNILFIDADTAGVSGLIPTSGNVTFTANGSSTAVPVDNSGIAEIIDCNPNCLVPGQYVIGASYGGDGFSYNASPNATPVTITVTKGNPMVAVQAPATIAAGTAFTLQAAIGIGLGSIAPTGTIQFMDGTTALGSAVTVSGGQASMQVTLNSGGVHSLTAVYSGDGTYNTATSGANMVTVTTPFNFSSTSTSQTVTAGQSATFNLVLNGVGGFSGAVNLTCSGAPSGANCSINPSTANLSATTTSVPLTVTVSTPANAAHALPHSLKGLPFVFAGIVALGLAGLRRRPRQRLLLLAVMSLAVLVGGLSSCGGGGNNANQPLTSTSTLTVTGTSGSVTDAVTLTLTVNSN